MNDLWGEVRSAVGHARQDHERIGRVVWLLWEYREEGDAWEALKDYAVQGLDGCEAGTVALGDVVEWMCAEGERAVINERAHYGWRSPSAWFRGAMAWSVIMWPNPGTIQAVWDGWFQMWDGLSWCVKQRAMDYGTKCGGCLGAEWPDHLDTQPLRSVA